MKTFEITCPVGREPRLDDIRYAAGQALRLRRNAVINVIDPTKSFQPTMVRADAVCRIARRSIDARGDLKMVYKIEAYYADEPWEDYKIPEYQDVHDAEPVIVVGSGPAGMFAALKLLSLGMKPVVLERGKDVHKRKVDMAALSRNGIVNPDSNYCYGEGGAGTFSDGKLFTRSSKRGDIREVLHQFVAFGADPSILIDSHPHIGTDKLPKVVENIRKCVLEHGGEYHFGTRVTDLSLGEDGVYTVTAVKDGETVEFRAADVILATGHSARDIYEMLDGKGYHLEPKGFALGVRVEHPQSLINRMRYHGDWEPGIPAAEYSFVEQVCTGEEPELPEEENESGESAPSSARGVFSFCMCPGGILVPSATEPGTTVLNGMSNSARNSKWANSGVVVSIEPGDEPEQYASDGAFSLLNYQRDIEKGMFDYVASVREMAENQAKELSQDDMVVSMPWTSAGDGEINPAAAPAQRMIDFCNGIISSDLPETSYKPGVVSAPLHKLLPSGVAARLQKVFPVVNRKVMRGYFTNDALLLGVESRTSSPVRVTRDPETFQCAPGLYPCGEGAGYSGGIVSSAIDGINCALAVARRRNPSPVSDGSAPQTSEQDFRPETEE